MCALPGLCTASTMINTVWARSIIRRPSSKPWEAQRSVRGFRSPPCRRTTISSSMSGAPSRRLLTAEHRQFNITLVHGLSASQKALRLFSLYSDAMNATDDQTQTDRARRDKRSWGIPSASVAFAAKQASEWHRWYAWHPVICDNAPGGVVWGLTILRRRERGRWVYRMGLRNRRV